MQQLDNVRERIGNDDERMFRNLMRCTGEAGITAQSRFAEAFKEVTNLRVAEVKKANVESLSESQAKKALLIACKIACNVSQLYQRQTTLSAAYKDLSGHSYAQVGQMMDEMQDFVGDYENLKREQADTAKRYEDSETKLRQKASELRQRLTQAGATLDALRSSNRELTNKVAALEQNLETAVPNDTQLEEKVAELEAKVDELEEKLRCPICMDRPKDTVFACGHTCCKECAGEWNKCYYNCKSEPRRIPAGHTFPLYLS